MSPVLTFVIGLAIGIAIGYSLFALQESKAKQPVKKTRAPRKPRETGKKESGQVGGVSTLQPVRETTADVSTIPATEHPEARDLHFHTGTDDR